MFLSSNENQLVGFDVIHLMEIGSIFEMKKKEKTYFRSLHKVEYLLKCKVYILQKKLEMITGGHLKISASASASTL